MNQLIRILSIRCPQLLRTALARDGILGALSLARSAARIRNAADSGLGSRIVTPGSQKAAGASLHPQNQDRLVVEAVLAALEAGDVGEDGVGNFLRGQGAVGTEDAGETVAAVHLALGVFGVGN